MVSLDEGNALLSVSEDDPSGDRASAGGAGADAHGLLQERSETVLLDAASHIIDAAERECCLWADAARRSIARLSRVTTPDPDPFVAQTRLDRQSAFADELARWELRLAAVHYLRSLVAGAHDKNGAKEV